VIAQKLKRMTTEITKW